MDFSWATITFIDIGIFSLGVIAVATGWFVQKREAQRYNTLQREYESLQQELSNFQSAADQRYNALQQEYESVKKENATLRAGLDALTREHKALQTAQDRLSGRHDELVERVMPVFEILAREKLMEINARDEN